MAHDDMHGGEPKSGSFGTAMAILFVLSILYAVSIYFDWFRISPV